MTPASDPRRIRRSMWLASTLAALLVAASCTSLSPTPSPLGSSSITVLPTGGASSPAPGIEADSVAKIDAAELAGSIDHDTALVDKLEAALDYASLPVEFQSSNPATPEATEILAELSGRLDALPAELRAKVAPFFLRPSDPDSFWRKGPATTAAAPGSIRLAAMSLAEYKISLIDYKYVDATKTAVRVWYPVCSALVPVADCHDPAGAAPFVERAQQLADEIDRSEMWDKEKTAMLGHEPCTDATSANNGGDGRLDIYLVVPFVGLDWGGRAGTLDSSTYGKTIAGAAVPETVGQLGCPATSHIILDANRPFDRLKFTAAHELFHAFQFSFKNATLGDRDWWAEASATWASDLVYRSLNYEQEYLKSYWSMAGGKDEGPLDNTAGMAEYGAYLWPFYLVQKSGDASGTAVGRLWQASEAVAPIQAMAQLPGWSDSFKEFALWNWNKESFSVKYIDAGAQIAATKLSQDTTCILGIKTSDCPLKLGKTTTELTQFPTSVQYYEGVPDQAVQLLKFDLSQVQGKSGLGIQALLSIGQDTGTKVEDWTGLSERKFCLNSEDLQKIVLVISNSGIDSNLTGAIKVDALPAGCGGFVGELSQKGICSPMEGQCTWEMKATGVRFELLETQHAISYYAPVSGTVTYHSEHVDTGMTEDATSSIPGDLIPNLYPPENVGLIIDATDPNAPTYTGSSQIRFRMAVVADGVTTFADINQGWFEVYDPGGASGLPVSIEGGLWVLAGTRPGPNGAEGLVWRFTGSP